MQAPLEVVALDHERPGDLAVLAALPRRTDVHEQRALTDEACGLPRRVPLDGGTRVGEQVVDGSELRRHEARRSATDAGAGAGASGSSVHAWASLTS